MTDPPRRRKSILRSKRGLAILSIAVAATALFVWWSRGIRSRPSSQEPLTEAEVRQILGQLEIQPISMPVVLTTWFSEDEGVSYGLDVKCIFRRLDGKDPFSAYWITPSNQWDLDRFEHKTGRLLGPSGREGATWQALPVKSGDLFYKQDRPTTGPVSSERYCLVRTVDDEITLYISQSGPPQEIAGRAVLRRYPIRDWGPIPQQDGPTYMRWRP